MVILIPFFLLKLRKQIEKSRSIENMNALQSLIFDDILKLIQKNVVNGNITIADARRLQEMVRKLYLYLYAGYEEFKKGGLNAKMEDDYFILETDIIEYETTKRVTEKVMAEDQLAVIRKLYSKLKDVDQVADLLDLQTDVVVAAVADELAEVQPNQTVGQKG